MLYYIDIFLIQLHGNYLLGLLNCLNSEIGLKITYNDNSSEVTLVKPSEFMEFAIIYVVVRKLSK